MFRVWGFAALLCSTWGIPTHFEPTDSGIHYSGRFLVAPGNVSFVWSGSSISTTFTGTSIGVEMRDPHGQYDIIVDGQRSFVPFAPNCSDRTPFQLASQLLDGSHTFTMRRRTEAYSNEYGDGTASLFSIYVDQGKTLIVTKPQAAPRRIEVIGDSITCGSGILGENATCGFSFGAQDYFSTYSALVAQHFKAEIHAICWSAKGLTRNYNKSQDACRICPDAMPAYFEHTLDSLDGNKWEFGKYQPDVVIINLGVNDFDKENPAPRLEDSVFKQNYTQFVLSLRSTYYRYDNLQIFLVCRASAFLAGPCQLIEEVVLELNSVNVHFVNITPADEPYSSLGCEDHPGLKGHRMMADILIASVGPITGWTAEAGSSPIEASSAVLLAAFFLVGIGGHVWGCVVRKPSKAAGKETLLEQKER